MATTSETQSRVFEKDNRDMVGGLSDSVHAYVAKGSPRDKNEQQAVVYEERHKEKTHEIRVDIGDYAHVAVGGFGKVDECLWSEVQR